MALQVDLQLASDAADIPAAEQFQAWADAALQATTPAELTIRVVDSEESAELNQTYRHKAGPTNVLSFPFESEVPLEIPLLGDLVICAPVVQQEAQQQSKTIQAHWAHMVVHGVLHLQGFDHQTQSEAQEMETLEIQILADLDFSNPYEVITHS